MLPIGGGPFACTGTADNSSAAAVAAADTNTDFMMMPPCEADDPNTGRSNSSAMDTLLLCPRACQQRSATTGFAAFGSVEQHPSDVVVAEIEKAVFDAGRDERQLAGCAFGREPRPQRTHAPAAPVAFGWKNGA